MFETFLSDTSLLEIFLLVSGILYAVEYAVMYIGVRRVHRLPRVVPDPWPEITIVVAARNEEGNIGPCLEALTAQDYPVDRMRIIAVNDESEDDTLAIMERTAAANPGVLTILSTVPEDSPVHGKARAIAQGMDLAGGEIVLFTDADCQPPPVWARSVVEHFTPEVGCYTGFTIVRDHDLFSGIQQLDWIHLHTIASSALRFGIPMGCIGNNFAIRRDVYEKVGGYRGTRFSVTEDFALMMAVLRAGHLVVFPCTAGISMITNPSPTLTDVLRQKKRWARGGIEMGWRGKSVLVVAVFMMIALVLSPFVSAKAWALVWGTKFICDLLVVIPNTRRLGRMRTMRYFPVFEFYFIAQALVTPLLLINRKVVWKGREYRS